MEISIQQEKELNRLTLIMIWVVIVTLIFATLTLDFGTKVYYAPPAPFPVEDSVFDDDGNWVPANP